MLDSDVGFRCPVCKKGFKGVNSRTADHARAILNDYRLAQSAIFAGVASTFTCTPKRMTETTYKMAYGFTWRPLATSMPTTMRHSWEQRSMVENCTTCPACGLMFDTVGHLMQHYTLLEYHHGSLFSPKSPTYCGTMKNGKCWCGLELGDNTLRHMLQHGGVEAHYHACMLGAKVDK